MIRAVSPFHIAGLRINNKFAVHFQMAILICVILGIINLNSATRSIRVAVNTGL